MDSRMAVRFSRDGGRNTFVACFFYGQECPGYGSWWRKSLGLRITQSRSSAPRNTCFLSHLMRAIPRSLLPLTRAPPPLARGGGTLQRGQKSAIQTIISSIQTKCIAITLIQTVDRRSANLSFTPPQTMGV